MDMLTTITPYHWFALGLLMLTAEMLGTSGFLIGAAVAALGMGIVVLLAPELTVGWQVLLYVISGLVATFVYFRLFRDAQKAEGSTGLNRRASRLIGHQFELDTDVTTGVAKVQIGDTLWRVRSDNPISKGTMVEVVDARRMSLVIAAK
ncbi:MAG: NfeD family protein [Pseudomonadota bacterium]